MGCGGGTDFRDASFNPGYDGDGEGPHVNMCYDWENTSPCEGSYYIDESECSNKQAFANWADVHGDTHPHSDGLIFNQTEWNNTYLWDDNPFVHTLSYDDCQNPYNWVWVNHYPDTVDHPYYFVYHGHDQAAYVWNNTHDVFDHHNTCGTYVHTLEWYNYPHSQIPWNNSTEWSDYPHADITNHTEHVTLPHDHTPFINFCDGTLD